MSNLVLQPRSSLTKHIVKNQLSAAVTVSFTAYCTGCILLFHDNKEVSKGELLSDLYRAAYCTWKWYMGLGPEPEINTGIPKDDQCRRLR